MFLKQIFLSEMIKKVVCFCFIKCTCVQKGPFSQLLATCYATIYYLPPWAWSERDSAQGHIASDKCHTTNGESMNWRWRSAHMTMHISLCQCCWMQTLNKQHDSVPPRRTCIGLHFIIDVAAKWAHLIEQIGPVYAALECLATMNPQDVLEVLADSLCGNCSPTGCSSGPHRWQCSPAVQPTHFHTKSQISVNRFSQLELQTGGIGKLFQSQHSHSNLSSHLLVTCSTGHLQW